MPECKNCIHIEVCKSADSCDGRVPGCRHFEPKPKHGRWLKVYTCSGEWLWGYSCDQCNYEDGKQGNYCPNCGADMRATEEATE